MSAPSEPLALDSDGQIYTPAERREAVERAAAELAHVEDLVAGAAEHAARLRALLGDLLAPGEVIVTDTGHAVTLERPRPGARRVDHAAVIAHQEALAPLGLGPRPQPPRPAEDRYPGVAELVSARDELARVGLSVERLVIPGAERAPYVRVIAPEEDS